MCDKEAEQKSAQVSPEPTKKASELLAASAGPFDAACMMVIDLEQRMETIAGLLEAGFDSENMDYDLQAVNQAHRIAVGGPLPRTTQTKGGK